MKLKKLLADKKAVIVKKWFHALADTYHPETSRLLKGKASRFANPVGSAFATELERLYDCFLAEDEPEAVHTCLDRIIRIRAIQDFFPSQAVAFLFQLKTLIREELGGVVEREQLYQDLSQVESELDRMALAAFDIYMARREKVHELREKELRLNSFPPLEAGRPGAQGRKRRPAEIEDEPESQT
jgi:hypothetical protein